jgi:hypothetical protein
MLLGIGIRTLLMLIPALLFFLPLWGGAPTFLALTSASDLEHFVHAPVGLISDPLQAFFKLSAQTLHIGAPVAPDVAADVALRASTIFIFILIYLHLFKALRPASEKEPKYTRPLPSIPEPTIDTLLNCWGVAIFWYMVLVSGWFWPWYFLWLLWIITLQRLTVFTSAMLLLSGTALFIYPFIGFSKLPLETYQTAIIFGIPLCYLIGVNLWHSHWAERIKKVYGRRRSKAAQD